MSTDKDLANYDPEIALIPRPNFEALQYYESEITRLNDELKSRHKEYMAMSAKLDLYRVKRLEKFRAVFVMFCLVLNVDLDLIRCRDTIAEGRCTFSETCKPRKDLIEKLHLDTEEGPGVQPSEPSSSLP